MKYAQVLIPQKIFGGNETLTYSIPNNSSISQVSIGQVVKIPLKNRITNGIIWEIHNHKPSFRTLPIKEIQEAQPLLSKNQITLIKWMSDYYFCPLHIILKTFIPKRILSGKPIRSRNIENKIKKSPAKTLTPSQKKSINQILSSKSNSHLLHGITGSGKTEVYTKLADSYLKNNQQVLILVPEISLTPQIIEYFEKTLGIVAETIHSKLSEGEKYKTWQNIWQNKSKLIIGSRSAIFAPFQDLGLIIIDEEHELSYKQDKSPRYSIEQIAKKMQKISPKLKVVYGSATPKIETHKKLEKHTIHLNERIGNSELPKIEIIDLRDEFKKKNYSIFSEKLHELLAQTLVKKEQAILFINRRGSASSIICRDCGHTIKCNDCDIPMTYHAKTLGSPKLICHHCGDIKNPPNLCPNCQSHNIKFLGIGTQRIESELAKEFPQARILRADKDTTSTKHGFRDIYKKFKNHEADILVGTQMIAKGLDLPKVNLVGVILADIGLNIPDFRSTERNFQLMTQVAGRAGRASNNGKVLIQTYNPENQALHYTQTHDYLNFYKYEITQRKILLNPPFSQLTKLLIQDQKFLTCKSKAEKLEQEFIKIAQTLRITEKIEINTYPAYLARIRNKFQYIILVKDKSDKNLIHKLLKKTSKTYIMDPNIKIDIDPTTTT